MQWFSPCLYPSMTGIDSPIGEMLRAEVLLKRELHGKFLDLESNCFCNEWQKCVDCSWTTNFYDPGQYKVDIPKTVIVNIVTNTDANGRGTNSFGVSIELKSISLILWMNQTFMNSIIRSTQICGQDSSNVFLVALLYKRKWETLYYSMGIVYLHQRVCFQKTIIYQMTWILNVCPNAIFWQIYAKSVALFFHNWKFRT